MSYDDPFERVNNPFAKRASERIISTDVFLSFLSPEPLSHHFKFQTNEDDMFERLIVIAGTPGAGKTTISRLFELDCLLKLSKSSDNSFNDLKKVLHTLRALQEDGPTIVGTRIPMDQRFRDIWELEEFPERTRQQILESYIESKAILGWIRQFEAVDIDLRSISVEVNDASSAEAKFLNYHKIEELKSKAQEIEEALFELINSIEPSKEIGRVAEIIKTYRPFGNIKGFKIDQPKLFSPRTLRPLAIIDDAHDLHQAQFEHLKQFLIDRKFKLGRWLVTRLDALGLKQILTSSAESEEDDLATAHGPIAGRDMRLIVLHDKVQSRDFQRIARSISGRYLQKMPSINRGLAGSAQLDQLLRLDTPEYTTKKVIESLNSDLWKAARSSSFGEDVVLKILDEVDQYLNSSDQKITIHHRESVRLAMAHILIHRQAKRTPQQDFFDAEFEVDVKAKSDVFHAAKVQLAHRHNLPLFYEFETLCDCASLNIEQFLMFSKDLVYFSSDQIGKGKSPQIRPPKQHELIIASATRTYESISFPFSTEAKRLVDRIADRCLVISAANNAWIGAGCSAYGIEQEEFDKFIESEGDALEVKVLKFAIAYNMLHIRHGYSCQGKTWALLELGGIPLVINRLTLKKGGFDKHGSIKQLREFIRG